MARDPLARYAALVSAGDADRDAILKALRELADLQSRADDLIDELILTAARARKPSVREIAHALNLSSSGSVSKRLERIRAGRAPRRHRPDSQPGESHDG